MRESMGGYPSPASDGAALHLRRSPVSTPPLASDRDAAPSAGFRWGFVSLDCGGKENYTDELGLNWTPDDYLIYGEAKDISTEYETGKQYTSMRLFPADSRKYCYKLNVLTKIRYLIRATFFYGDFDSNNVYPKFDISFGATHWSTIEILDTTVVVRELIFLASSPTIDVCLSNAATGQPFISTLELRQFNGSIYGTLYEDRFYLKVSRRINFGADSEAPVRYPDDPFDRIWKSDNLNKSDYLADKAVGTVKVSTKLPIVMNDREEMPPEKVMQTAVVGTNGSLTYRLSLDSFPGFGWANMYLAEIEDLELNESRKFRVVHTDHPELSNDIINIQENAHGKDRAFEAGFRNMSLPFILSFKLEKTADSSRGPLLNAMEINSYLKRNDGSLDGGAIENVIALDSSADWAQEGGDPCLPVPWSWLQCNSDPRPSITVIHLSSKNLKGDIPLDLTKLSKLVELWLDGNSLTGSIPDFSICPDLKIIHLENNRLTGELPSSLANLPILRELHVQNNRLSGTVPSGLLNKNLDLNYSGNIGLHGRGKRVKHLNIIIGSTVGAAVLLIATIVSCLFLCKGKKSHYDQDHVRNSLPVQRPVSSPSDAPSEAAHCFTLSDIEEATKSFEKKIGSGGFGVVYYGKLKDGKEIAVKVLTSNSCQGKREFSNEVNLLSRIHHRNLIQFLGYCQEEGRSMLVYEFMQNGTLKEHLYGVLTSGQSINWIKRLEIAEDAAKGIEYLHSGCVPAIIHRDLKTTNILLDKHMRAKVSDFGLSKLVVDGASHVSSAIQGTVGYLDPEYYISQQLTDKSDVYSFGVILLELISGQEAISNESFGVNCRNIVQWAKMHIESDDIQGIIDPMIRDEYDIQALWKVAEKALMCVQPHGNMRPSISEVLKDVQDAILIEREAAKRRKGNSDEMSKNYVHSSLNMSSLDIGGTENYLSLGDSIVRPTAR
ncbi:hypothetical protein QYF36_009691 [Acer negundo]|nr:hypothetical protein QYF36_009691 [Acer negundo]